MHRILYYCQSLVGIGHLSTSLRVVDQLLRRGAAVDLIQGGLDTHAVPEHPRFRRLKLPTLLHDSDSGGLVDPDGQRDPAAVWPERTRAIGAFLRAQYDAIVVEFWPFGRRRFKPEITGLIAAVQAGSGRIPVFTSVREVLVPRPLDKERRMVETVKKHIHTVFVRGDEHVVRLHDTFSLAHEIEDRIVHTGYIAPPAPALPAERQPRVLVSQGGGQVGHELLEAAIAAAALLPQLFFLLAAGARATPDDLGLLRSQSRSGNVEVVPFLADFPQQLAHSALSISLGGDNTLIDVLAARTPALAYPYQGNPEQGIRIAKFAAKGLVHALGPEDLSAARLAQRIGHALAAPYPAHRVAMDGARVTSDLILAALA